MESIPLWGQVSITAALLGIVVWIIIAVLSGRLVPRAMLEDEKQHTINALAEKEAWREAWQAGQEVLTTLTSVAKELSASSETLEAFLKALPKQGVDDDG